MILQLMSVFLRFVANSEMTVMNELLNAHISSPVGQPFSFTGAPPDEVLWVGDQLHISISARISGRREGLSLTERVENSGKVEQCCPVWLHLASHHAQQLCLTLILCASTSVTSSLDSAATLQTAKRPRRSSLQASIVRALSVIGSE